MFYRDKNYPTSHFNPLLLDPDIYDLCYCKFRGIKFRGTFRGRSLGNSMDKKLFISTRTKSPMKHTSNF